MSQWPFVIASYAVTLAGVCGLIGWAWSAMRRAEAMLDQIVDQ